MPMSNKDRQRQYRLSRKSVGDFGEYRINTYVTGDTHFNLKRIARRYNISQRQVIELLIGNAHKAIVDKMEIDSPEWNEYFKRF